MEMSRNRIKACVIAFEMKPEVKKQIVDYVNSHNITISEFMRECVKEKFDGGTKKPSD